MNAFWMELSMYLLPIMYSNQRFFKMEVKSLPTHEVRAMGLKLSGHDGSFSADFFPINLIAAIFQSLGISEVDQQQLYKSKRSGTREGHRLKIVYGIWLKGDGDDECLDS